jgi:hypothetical protein
VRHLVNAKVGLMARNSPAAIAKIEVLMKDASLTARLRRACQDPGGAEASALIGQILPLVTMSARVVPYTDKRRESFRGTILAHHRLLGPSSRAPSSSFARSGLADIVSVQISYRSRLMTCAT